MSKALRQQLRYLNQNAQPDQISSLNIVHRKIYSIIDIFVYLVRYQTSRVQSMWWQGLPSSVRGTVWKLAIGNDLNITQGD